MQYRNIIEMTILDFSLGQLGGSQSIAFIPSKLPPHTHQVVGNITPYGAADAFERWSYQ